MLHREPLGKRNGVVTVFHYPVTRVQLYLPEPRPCAGSLGLPVVARMSVAFGQAVPVTRAMVPIALSV
jgi:hypothetical protein